MPNFNPSFKIPFKHGKKNKFLSISVLVSEIVTFLTKKKNSLWISPKMFQTTEIFQNNRKAYLSPFTGLIKNICLNISIFSSRFVPFKHGKKNKFLSISVLVSEIVTFLTKKKSSLWISPNFFKTTEKHSLAVCGSFCGKKHFMLIFIPFDWFDQKTVV